MRANLFNPEMLTLARDLRGLSRTKLAEAIGVSSAFLGQVEAGAKPPPEERRRQLAEALQVDEEFFFNRDRKIGLGFSVVFYRKRAATSARAVHQVEAEVNLFHMMARRLEWVVEIDSPCSIQRMDLEDHRGDPERVAALVRASWGIPRGPVKNLIREIERAGALVFRFPFPTRDIDAISVWPSGSRPLFFVNSDAPVDRMRFSLAHELGHMVMHESPTGSMEHEANQFASAFLMPADDILPELRARFSTADLPAHKMIWRASMAAIMRRASDLEAITPRRYTQLNMWLNATGQRRREGHELSMEEPELWYDLLEEAIASEHTSEEDLACGIGLHVQEFRRLFCRSSAQVRLAGECKIGNKETTESMSKSKNYSVGPHEEGWQVRRDGAERASSVYDTKSKAIEAGIKLAKATDGELRIKGENGRIQNTNTYGPRDPNPPKDTRH